MIDLYKGDCLEVMDRLIADGVKVDAIITDPPYEFKKGGFGGGKSELSKRALTTDLVGKLDMGFNIEQLFGKFKKLQNKINAVVFCAEEQMIDMCNYCRVQGYTYTVMIWHKTNPTPLCNNRYLNSIEFYVHIREKGVKIYGNYHTKSKVYRSSVNKKDKILYNHPTVKPIELISNLVLNHSVEDDVILDCFMGSGTTGVACMNTHRNFIGIELDKGHFNIATKRIDDAWLAAII